MGGSITIGFGIQRRSPLRGGWTNSTMDPFGPDIAGPDDWLHKHFDRNEPAPLAPMAMG